MSFNSKWISALAVLVLMGIFAESSMAQRVTSNEIRVSAFPDVTTLISVTDAQGNPVSGLTDSDFTLEEDGVEQQLTVRELGTTGSSNISSSLVIDRSGSMSGGKLSDAKTAAKTFVDNLVSGDRASVLSFSDNSRVDQTFTSDVPALKSAIDGLGSGGGTALFDATIRGIEEVELESNRRAVLALTDGNDNESSNSVQDVIDRANQAGIPVYTIALGSSPDTNPLQEIANQTGGRFFQAPSSSDLDDIYQEISNQLGNRYELTYTTTNSALDGTQRTVDVDASFGGTTESTTTFYTAPFQRSSWSANFQSTPTPGSSVSVSILITSILDLFRATLALEYSASDLSFQGSQVGSLLGNNPQVRVNVDSSTGTIGFGLRRTSSLSGGTSLSGQLVQVDFNVDQNATNPLVGISNVDARDSDGTPIAVTASGLSNIEGSVQSPASGYDTGGLSVSAFNSDGDIIQSTTTGSGGGYNLKVEENSTYDVRVTGVPGTPQSVNTSDAFDAFLFYLSGTGLSSFQQGVADVDGNGSVGISDAFAIYSNSLGRPNSAFEIGQVYSETVRVSTDNGQDVTGADLSYAAAGDVDLNGSFSTSSPTSSKSLAVEGDPVTDKETRSVEPGEMFEIPVRATRSANLGAFELSFDYPADVASFEGVESHGRDVQSNSKNGSVKLGWFDRDGGNAPISVASDDPVLTLRFEAQEGISKQTFEVKNVDGELIGPEGKTLSKVGVKVPTVESTPNSFTLRKNAPNPFADRTSIKLDMPESGQVTVNVFNSLGQQVRTVQRQLGAGRGKTVELDGSTLGSGVYVYKLTVETGSDTFHETSRMTVVK